jgi:hypothetical protein
MARRRDGDGKRRSSGGHESRVAAGGVTAPAEVVIVDGNPLVGQALELLLASTSYNVTYLEKNSLEQPGILQRVRLILLAPGWSIESRQAVLAAIEKEPAVARRIQVLEMGPPPEGVRVEPERHVPWPCRTKDLKLRIEAALPAGSLGK